MSAAAHGPYRAYMQLLAQLVRNSPRHGVIIWASALILAGVAYVLLVVGHHEGATDLARGLAIGLAAGLVFMWCGLCLQSAIRQNLPSHACLVPQLRRRLMTLTVALYAISTLSIASLAAFWIGHFGYVFAACSAFFLFVLFVQRYVWLSFLPAVVILGSAALHNKLLEQIVGLAEAAGEPLFSGAALCISIVLLAFGLRAAFPKGGDRHWAWIGKGAARAQRACDMSFHPSFLVLADRWLSWCRVGYSAALARHSRHGASSSSTLLALGPIAYGAGGPLTYVMLTALSALLAVLWAGGMSDLFKGVMRISIVQVSVLMAPLTYAVGVASAVSARSGEEALLRLTPGTPPPDGLNRMLAKAMLLRFMLIWTAATACVIGIDSMLAGAWTLTGVALTLAALMLSFASLMLRDYAALPARRGPIVMVVCMMLVMATYMLALLAERKMPAAFLWWLSAGMIIGSAVLLRWRWQRMIGRPPAFPAGRMAA